MAEFQKKRCREEEQGQEDENGGIFKRFCGLTAEAEELVHMLEEAEEEINVAEEDILCGVMKSLEEEISSCCCSENGSENRNVTAELEAGSCEVSGDQMSYLLTASDDELGIPPSPSLVESPLYEPLPENVCYADGLLWQFEEECNPIWPEYVCDEYEERDFEGCGSEFELSKGEQTLCAV